MESLVSIIIPTHGGSIKLKRAISSLLLQTYPNIEIIVVDDNSPESNERAKTEQIMKDFSVNKNVQYIKHSINRNGSAARNTGLRNAKGDFIGFLDDDDFYFPKKVECCVDALEKETTYGMVYCGVIHISRFRYDGFQLGEAPEDIQRDLMLGKFSIGTGSNMFFTKLAINKTGMFDEEFIRYQDIEYVLRVLKNFKAIAVKDLLIVKDSNGRNFPKYKKLYSATMLFLTKFQDLIKSYPSEVQNSIMEYYFGLLWNSTFLNTDKNDLLHATKNYEMYHTLTDLETKKYKRFYSISYWTFLKIKLKNNLVADLIKRFIGKKTHKLAVSELGFENALYVKKNMK